MWLFRWPFPTVLSMYVIVQVTISNCIEHVCDCSGDHFQFYWAYMWLFRWPFPTVVLKMYVTVKVTISNCIEHVCDCSGDHFQFYWAYMWLFRWPFLTVLSMYATVQVAISNCSIEHVCDCSADHFQLYCACMWLFRWPFPTVVLSMYVIVQVTIFLLEKLDVLLLKTSEEEIQTDILPLIFNSLVSNNIQCQVKRTPKSGFSKSCSSTCFTG